MGVHERVRLDLDAFFQESHAQATLAALKSRLALSASVRRDGRRRLGRLDCILFGHRSFHCRSWRCPDVARRVPSDKNCDFCSNFAGGYLLDHHFELPRFEKYRPFDEFLADFLLINARHVSC